MVIEKPKAPCLNCEKREVGCHAICEKYQEFFEAQIRYNELIRKKRSNNL